MSVQFRDEDFDKIGSVLGTAAKRSGRTVRFEIEPSEQKRKLALEIYGDIAIGKKRGTLISVYTPTAHLQLHFCTGYVISEMLGELTFVAEAGGKICGLTVEREGGCSLYANVDRDILSGDFTTLGPEVMMSGIALSLTEGVLPVAPKQPSGRRTKKGRSGRKSGKQTKKAGRAMR